MLEVNGVRIERFVHAAFSIKRDDLQLYIDPFRLPDGLPKGDLVFVTHEHMDHCSIEDLKKVVGPNTLLILPPDCQSKILAGRIGCKDMLLVKPGVRLSIGAIKVEATHAYNVNKHFHPKDNDWVGYVIEIGGVRIYHSGDTDVIAEMRDLKDIDVALLPVGGTYTMTGKEAAEAASLFNPKIAVPMHYGAIVGSVADAEEFAQNWSGKTRILG